VLSAEGRRRVRGERVDDLDAGGPALLGIDISGDAGEIVVALSGELDLSNVDSLKGRLEPLLLTHPRIVVFDVGDLRFLDSSGIGLLLTVAKRVGAVRLRHPSDIVREIVGYTGLSDILPIEP
jgi:anti-sigma B factor antagonist